MHSRTATKGEMIYATTKEGGGYLIEGLLLKIKIEGFLRKFLTITDNRTNTFWGKGGDERTNKISTLSFFHFPIHKSTYMTIF